MLNQSKVLALALHMHLPIQFIYYGYLAFLNVLIIYIYSFPMWGQIEEVLCKQSAASSAQMSHCDYKRWIFHAFLFFKPGFTTRV